MKTQIKLTQYKVFSLAALVLSFAMIAGLNTANAQSEAAKTSLLSNVVKASDQTTIKGNVRDNTGPLPGASVALKGTEIATYTDKDGVFVFPQDLNPGDILVFSYLGYKTQEIVIKEDTTVLRIVLEEELIDILESVQVNKPYKSKRKGS
ncbi:carboxypeptidase-like regulatory domain-containing protein [Winogradskyella sp. 3972H.M.0a.05]|uniref:carboxypeptidase-like regulatory domain-containing protein n=1 Tax=Winogradskyella sp. 3972H.M.0a.05 TaxID=2950277 RepID=UPI003393F7EF